MRNEIKIDIDDLDTVCNEENHMIIDKRGEEVFIEFNSEDCIKNVSLDANSENGYTELIEYQIDYSFSSSLFGDDLKSIIDQEIKHMNINLRHMQMFDSSEVNDSFLGINSPNSESETDPLLLYRESIYGSIVSDGNG